jgi:hypothetical protein
MTIKCFEDLEIWQEAREFIKYLKNSPLKGSKFK